MTTNTLKQVQATLENHGVKDVKFYFNPDVEGRPNSDVKADVAYLLSTYERGDFLPMPKFNDSKGRIGQ